MEKTMTTDDSEEMLKEVFAGVFGRPIDISAPLTREAFGEWDSLRHIEIMFAIEAATGRELHEDQIAEIRSVDDIRAILRN